MVIFHSYVSLPEGIVQLSSPLACGLHHRAMSRSQRSAFLQATRLRTPADTVEADATWSPMGPTPSYTAIASKTAQYY